MKVLSGLALTVVFAAGCAGGFKTVPAARWDTVPTAVREPIDAAADAKLATARGEQAAAAAAVVEARKPLLLKVAPRAAVTTVAPEGAEASWTAELKTQDQRKTEALLAIDAARLAAQRATLAWRERRLDAATAHVAVFVAEREFKRAHVIDRRMNQDESYDVPSFRGQLAHAQARWYRAEDRVTEARLEAARAGGALAAAKERFARLIRIHDPVLVEFARSPMQLTGWTYAADMRRRGFKVTDTSASPACRRSKCFRHSSSETSYLMIPKRKLR